MSDKNKIHFINRAVREAHGRSLFKKSKAAVTTDFSKSGEPGQGVTPRLREEKIILSLLAGLVFTSVVGLVAFSFKGDANGISIMSSVFSSTIAVFALCAGFVMARRS